MSSPEPTSPAAGSVSKPSAPSPANGGSKFGALPVLGLGSSLLVLVGGVVMNVLAAGATVTATCGGDRMRPGDLCETYRNNVHTGTQTYTEVLAAAQRNNLILQWLGILLAVLGLIYGVVVVIRWRQDVALKARLDAEQVRPDSAHARAAGTSVIAVIFGAGAFAIAGNLALTGSSRGEFGYYIGTVLLGAVGVVLLWLSFPKNGQLIQTFPGGVRVVQHNTVHDVAWADVNYVITPGKGQATHSINGPGMKQVTISGIRDFQTLQDIAQKRTVEHKIGPAIEAISRGETVTFGHFFVNRDGIGAGRKMLPWSEYGGISLHQGTVAVTKAPKGRFSTSTLAAVPNYLLLLNVIDIWVKRLRDASV